MEKYFSVTKINKSDNHTKGFHVISPFKRKIDFQNYSNVAIKKNKIENLESHKYNKNSNENEMSNFICETDNNCHLRKNEINKDEISKKVTLEKSDSLDDYCDILYTPNDKIENIFQDVYFSDIPCSQINSNQNETYKDNDSDTSKKEILSHSSKNPAIKNNYNIVNSNNLCRIQRISIFNDNVNNERNCYSDKEKKKLNEIDSLKSTPKDENTVGSQSNVIKEENGKKRIQSITINNNSNYLNKLNQNNINTSHRIKHISLFNNDIKNNKNEQIKNNDKNKNSINNIVLSNRLQKDEKGTSEKIKPPPQHIYIQEDKSAKVITDNQSLSNIAKVSNSNYSNKKTPNDNNKNNLDKFVIHKKNNTQLKNSKNQNSNKTVYLKKNSDIKDLTFSHSFHLSQASSDEDIDVEKMNFNFSSIIYDNPSTGAMKSCIGYLDPNYIKKGNSNNKETRIKGLKPFMDNRENKIGQQSTETQVSNIFKGVVVYINGFSRHCTDVELKRLVRIHGGKVCWYMSKTRVTHVICSSLCESKIQNYLNSKVNHYKMVTDEWIIDSIKANKRLSETPYLTMNALKKAQYQKNLFDYIKK